MIMREEYDFSKGERGKFYTPDVKLNIPIYLDEEISAFVDKIASKAITILSFVFNASYIQAWVGKKNDFPRKGRP